MSPEEIEKRKRIVDDYRRAMPHIPKDITDKLEIVLPDEANGPLLELMLVMLQLGRQLERADQQKATVVTPRPKDAQPSKLLNRLVDAFGVEAGGKGKVDIVLADERALDALHKKD
jgi:hypothetical protein